MKLKCFESTDSNGTEQYLIPLGDGSFVAVPKEQIEHRPIGKWIQLPSVYRPKEFACGFMCSLCKNPTYDRFRYCPNCGAEMSEESE